MGAGAKTDPTRIQVADISQTVYDPLARSVRQRLRAAGIPSTDGETSIPVVYSTEVPGDVALLPLPDEEVAKGKVSELSAFEDFSVRILPVLGPLLALFGLHIATYILFDLAGKPLERPLPAGYRKNVYEKLWKDLLRREERIAATVIGKLPVPPSDIAVLFEDISLARSVVPPHAVCTRPALVGWDLSRALTLENCVVAEQSEIQDAMAEIFAVGEVEDASALVLVDALGAVVKPERRVRRPEEVWGDAVAEAAERRFHEAKRFRVWALESRPRA